MKLFVHIEKCGGTTLHYSLLNTYPEYIVLPLVKKGLGWRVDEDTLKRLKKFGCYSDFYVGHQVSPIPDLNNLKGEGIQYFTFLREPISRYISHINWLLNTRDDFTLEELLETKNMGNIM